MRSTYSVGTTGSSAPSISPEWCASTSNGRDASEEFRFVFLVEVSPNVKIARVECFYSDPEALERFFSW